MVWALYPETNQRSLEEIDLLFSTDSPWVWEAEKNFKLQKEQNPDLVLRTGSRQGSVMDVEKNVVEGTHVETKA